MTKVTTSKKTKKSPNRIRREPAPLSIHYGAQINPITPIPIHRIKIFFHHAIGWYGMVAILLSYFGITNEWWDSRDLIYQALNLTGSLALGYEALRKKAKPLIALNAIWIVIASIAIIQILA